MEENKIDIDAGNSMDVLLKNIRELVAELHPSWPKTRKIQQDSLLSKDLGLDSLARVELLTRMEKSLNTTFEEKIFIDAETPRDLWQ
ncbi:MAG: acyl carrier protein, partial [Syntrophaceae bacterium]|nr:acyl carrier protein [Syntrophaceae bacterium]